MLINDDANRESTTISQFSLIKQQENSKDVEYKPIKKLRKNAGGQTQNNATIPSDIIDRKNISNNNLVENEIKSVCDDNRITSVTSEMDEKPSVKLVISKKKGSIFKSRAIDPNTG